MKLLNFYAPNDNAIHFGIVINGHAISFDVLQRKSHMQYSGLETIYSYLEKFPDSEEHARELQEYAINHFEDLDRSYLFSLNEVKILPPIPKPPALLDFGLSPRHLKNSAKTLIKHDFGLLKRLILSPIILRLINHRSDVLSYYKCNHNAIIGDSDSIFWPCYTSYLDIEPELAMVIGNEKKHIIGYTIFNDSSARDVQTKEFLGGTGPARSKDFPSSKGIGPYLVTTDEVEYPLNLDVTVKIGKRYEWHGSTCEYIKNPSEVVHYVNSIFKPLPGTIIGLGTIPGCSGLDLDKWICPGEEIEISIETLGTLHQIIPNDIGRIKPSPWGNRKELNKFYV